MSEPAAANAPSAASAVIAGLMPAIVPVPRELDEVEVRRRLAEEPSSLGSLSIGKPTRGALWNGVAVPEGPFWHVVDPKRAFGTAEAVRSILLAIQRVESQLPGGPRLHVGQLSSPRGGYLRPHRSHQSGRDVDLGFYYHDSERWYARATPENLDCARTWTLVRAFVEDPNVEMIFVDRSVQKLLREYAERIGEDPVWLDSLFTDKRRDEKLIRHERGHLTHLHVRFVSEEALAGGALAHRELVAARKIPPRRYY